LDPSKKDCGQRSKTSGFGDEKIWEDSWRLPHQKYMKHIRQGDQQATSDMFPSAHQCGQLHETILKLVDSPANWTNGFRDTRPGYPKMLQTPLDQTQVWDIPDF
jgi:hypothetical protein